MVAITFQGVLVSFCDLVRQGGRVISRACCRNSSAAIEVGFKQNSPAPAFLECCQHVASIGDFSSTQTEGRTKIFMSCMGMLQLLMAYFPYQQLMFAINQILYWDCAL